VSGQDPIRRRRAIEQRAMRETEHTAHTALGSGAEFDAIRRILERWGPRAKRIGDDAAIVTTLGDRALVVSTDSSIENVHFRADWLTPVEIGYRATTAALSDLAAMGAKPLGLLAALAVPEEWRSRLEQITDGIGDAAELAGAPILGGDMSRSGELGLTITVLGAARAALFRTSARPGDRVYVTGRLGGPFAALRAFNSGESPAREHRKRFARPVARITESIWLNEHGATAAIDISDGFAADIRHLAVASRVGITIQLDRLPCVDGVSPLDAAASGEEYELIVTAPAALDTSEFASRFGLELTEVGDVAHGKDEVRFMLGDEQVPGPPGYSHFTK
jgi:thiamine-monophosphate kinase